MPELNKRSPIEPAQYPPSEDDQVERMVDTMNISYFEARQRLGFTRDKVVADPTKREVARQTDQDYYTREFHLTGERTPEERQAAIEAMERGRPAVEAALRGSQAGPQ